MVLGKRFCLFLLLLLEVLPESRQQPHENGLTRSKNSTGINFTQDLSSKPVHPACSKCIQKAISVVRKTIHEDIKSEILKQINHHELVNGKCKSEIKKSSFFDFTTDTCRVCGESCSDKDFLCIEKCESFTMQLELISMFREELYQVEEKQNPIHTLAVSCLVVIIIGFAVTSVVFFICLQRMKVQLNEMSTRLTHVNPEADDVRPLTQQQDIEMDA